MKFSIGILVCLIVLFNKEAKANKPKELTPKMTRLSSFVEFVKLSPTLTVFVTQPWAATSLVVELSNGTIALADTPSTPRDTRSLLTWIKEQYGSPDIVAFNSHYHLDATGGNQVLAEAGIPIYGSKLTVQQLKTRGEESLRDVQERFSNQPKQSRAFKAVVVTPPNHVLDSTQTTVLRFGEDEIRVHQPGHGHSVDNIVVEFPKHDVVYGGCMIRGEDSLGYVGVAKFSTWLESAKFVERLNAKWVIPGHGTHFSSDNAGRTARLVRERIESLKHN